MNYGEESHQLSANFDNNDVSPTKLYKYFDYCRYFASYANAETFFRRYIFTHKNMFPLEIHGYV